MLLTQRIKLPQFKWCRTAGLDFSQKMNKVVKGSMDICEAEDKENFQVMAGLQHHR